MSTSTEKFDALDIHHHDLKQCIFKDLQIFVKVTGLTIPLRQTRTNAETDDNQEEGVSCVEAKGI